MMRKASLFAMAPSSPSPLALAHAKTIEAKKGTRAGIDARFTVFLTPVVSGYVDIGTARGASFSQ